MTLLSMKEYQNIVMRTPEEEDNKTQRAYSLIEQKLINYGLVEYEVELILDRYLSNLSLAEIADRQGYLNKQEVWKLLKRLTEKLSKSTEFKKILTKGE